MSAVRVPQISGPLEAFVNFRTREINRGARKLAWTPTLIKKEEKKNHHVRKFGIYVQL
jgi:hypothetical protein